MMTGSTLETLDSSKLAACTSQVSYLHFIDFVLACFGEFIFFELVLVADSGREKEMIIIRGANFYCYEAATDSTEAVLKMTSRHN